MKVEVFEVTRPNRRITIMIAVITVLVAFFAWGIVKYAISQRVSTVGDQAPNIQANTVSSTSFQLQSLQGEPVFLNYFTPWCQPCIQETPDLVQFAKQYDSRIHVVMIDRGDGPLMVKSYINKYHLPSTVTVLLDPYNRWSHPFGVTGQPETFLINGNGKIVAHLIGPLSEQEMVTAAKKAGMDVQG